VTREAEEKQKHRKLKTGRRKNRERTEEGSSIDPPAHHRQLLPQQTR